MYFTAYRVINHRISLEGIVTVFVVTGRFQDAAEKVALELTKNQRYFYRDRWVESGMLLGARETPTSVPHCLRFMQTEVQLRSIGGRLEVVQPEPSWKNTLRFLS